MPKIMDYCLFHMKAGAKRHHYFRHFNYAIEHLAKHAPGLGKPSVFDETGRQ